MWEELDMKKLTDTYTLNNGVKIPCIGYGTWQTPNGDVAIKAVEEAIKTGYRHIDTAAIYANEDSVGKAIKESGIGRDKIFITSKLWNSSRGYDKTLAAFDETMKKLQLEYIDLYLIHWPAAIGKTENWRNENAETWRAMEKLYEEGRIRAIGVSNFLSHHLEALLETANVKMAVDQIEFHPGMRQEKTLEFCRQNDILVEAWSPLGTGRMLANKTLGRIAGHYGKSVAQLCIRWCLQNGVLPLPKSVTPSRIAENANVFDFEISSEDMKTIDGMENFGGSGFNPDEITF
jgi:diketogulonate reductase-like aldo/keto reductase